MPLPFDPFSAFQSVVGQPQLGAPAPPFQSQPSAGLLGGNPLMQPQAIRPPLDLLSSITTPPASEQAGPPEQMGPPAELAGQTGFNGFFGNLDQNLQSPSKILGLGILGQMDPRLAQAGLLAGGLFGPNKLFGQ